VNGTLPGQVNLLSSVEYVPNTQNRYVDDTASAYDIPDGWETNTGGLVSPLADPIRKFWYYEYNRANPVAGLIRENLSLDATDPFYFHIMVLADGGKHDAIYRVYLLMDDATPDPSVMGAEVQLTLTTVNGVDVLAWEVFQTLLGVRTSIDDGVYTGFSVHDSRWFRIRYTPSTQAIQIIHENTSLIGSATLVFPFPSGTRCGWSMEPRSPGSTAMVDWVRIQYQLPSTPASNLRDTLVHRTVIGGGGEIWHERMGHYIEEVSSSWSLTTTGPVRAAQMQGKLYIADHSDILYEDTNALIAQVGAGPYNWGFESNPNVDLVTLGVNVNDYVVEVLSYSDATGADAAAVPLGTYAFTIISTGAGTNNTVQLVRQTSTVVTGATASIRIRRGAKAYNPAGSGTITQLQTVSTVQTQTGTYGTPPVGCKLIAEYRTRIVLATGVDYFMSAVGNPLDWEYKADPYFPNAAFTGRLATAGQVPRTITALIAYRDDFMLMGALDSIFVMRGDPGRGGQLVSITRDTGIVGGAAWCLTPGQQLYFIGLTGMFVMAGDGSSNPQRVSADSIPDELLNLDPNIFEVHMVYDEDHLGIRIVVTGLHHRQRQYSWWFDLKTQTFWPEKQDDDLEPLVSHVARGYYYSRSPAIYGCRDGTVRHYHANYRHDTEEPIESYLLVGPVRGSSAIDRDASVDEAVVVMKDESEVAQLSVFGASSPQQAVRNALSSDGQYTRQLRAGMNVGINPRVRGNSFVLRFDDVDGSVWSVAEAQLTAAMLGKSRP